jgi:hypothetical protein
MTPNPMNDFENMVSRAKKNNSTGVIEDSMRDFFARQEEIADQMRGANPGLSDDELTLKAFDHLFAEAKASQQTEWPSEDGLPVFLLPQFQGDQQATPNGSEIRSRRRATKRDAKTSRLSIQQHLAVYLLVTNKSITETAAAVGAQRRDVSEWVNWSEPFKAAMEQRRSEIWAVFVNQFRRLRQIESAANSTPAGDERVIPGQKANENKRHEEKQ